MRRRSSLLAVPARWLICLIFPLLVSGVPAAGVLGALPQTAVLASSAPSVLAAAAPDAAASAVTAPSEWEAASGDHVLPSPRPGDHDPVSHDLSGRPQKAVIGANRAVTGAGQTVVLADRRRPTTPPERGAAAAPQDGGADPLAAPGVSPGRAPPFTD
ncbi:hypothetical protein [Microtetraspora niveoalba]|uniref:hypothetical protein n=1 Tax=Microtetraspora niveoalba TaxID=46175 RepID=UPI00082B2AAC|nr:hypothetical protein [Microtetraspora niveoalba]